MRYVWLLHVVTFFFFFSFGIVIPVLPVYLTDNYGVPLGWVGWVVGLLPFAGILLRPWTGWLSDGWSRKWPTIIGLVISGLAGLAYFGSLPLLLVGRLLQGVGIALFAPSGLALTSDLTPENKLTAVMSTRNLLVGIGVMAGTAAGGWLAEAVGIWLVFTLVVVSQLVFAPLLLWLPETLVKRKVSSWWSGYAVVVRIKEVMAATVGNMGFAAVYGILQAFYPIILVNAGFSLALVGQFFAFYGLVSVIFRIPAGILAHRYGASQVALWGYGLGILGLLALSVAPLPPVAFAAAALMGMGSGFYLPCNLVVVGQFSPRDVRGSAFSMFTMSWDLGGVIGPVIGSLVAITLGPWTVLPSAALIAATIVLAYVMILGRTVLRPALK